MSDMIELALMVMTKAWPTDDTGNLLPCALCSSPPAGDAITTGAAAVHAHHDDLRGIVGVLAESEYVGLSDVQAWRLGPLPLGFAWSHPVALMGQIWVHVTDTRASIHREADIVPTLLNLWGVPRQAVAA